MPKVRSPTGLSQRNISSTRKYTWSSATAATAMSAIVFIFVSPLGVHGSGMHGTQGPQAHAFAKLSPLELRRVGERGAGGLHDQHLPRDRLEVGAKVHRALQREDPLGARLDTEVAEHLLVRGLAFARG